MFARCANETPGGPGLDVGAFGELLTELAQRTYPGAVTPAVALRLLMFNRVLPVANRLSVTGGRRLSQALPRILRDSSTVLVLSRCDAARCPCPVPALIALC